MNANNTNLQYHPMNLELGKNELDEIRTFFSFCADHQTGSPGSSLLFNLSTAAKVNHVTVPAGNSYNQTPFLNVSEKLPIDNHWLDQMMCEFRDDFLARNPDTNFIHLHDYFQKVRDSYTESIVRCFKNEPEKMISALNGMNRLIDLTISTIGQTIVDRENQLIDAHRNETDKLNREFEQFVYIISHDLQQPLTSLISINSILQEEFPELIADKPGIYLQYIRLASERMSTMITDLLNHSRIGRWS
ncbi:MAG TPA: histidine kinase dimerization/phospho-acceptor domain-containing protein, partial [Balneolales bacterium]|nr:histidine kinase dimerization/phospho-acceptor domain-containing protein [Balneolales bacterium]